MPDGLDEQTARNVIARRIMDSIERGERDPARLKAYALEGFSP